MKAAVYREHNKDPRKVVKIEEIDIPKIKPNEVLVKVEAASYNYSDLWGIWGRAYQDTASTHFQKRRGRNR
jgi:NADPH:quinone reductase-like Zn-dependent oxidoreductase